MHDDELVLFVTPLRVRVDVGGGPVGGPPGVGDPHVLVHLPLHVQAIPQLVHGVPQHLHFALALDEGNAILAGGVDADT